MQEAIKGRIKGYPNKAVAEMHRARCTIPLTVAHILQQKPQLVSPAVQTFHYRDMQDMKAAAKLAVFPPQVISTSCKRRPQSAQPASMCAISPVSSILLTCTAITSVHSLVCHAQQDQVQAACFLAVLQSHLQSDKQPPARLLPDS